MTAAEDVGGVSARAIVNTCAVPGWVAVVDHTETLLSFMSTTLQLGSAKALGPELEDYYNRYMLSSLVPTYSL